MYETFGQQYAFLFMAVSGLAMGAVFHLCFALERLMQAGRLLTAFTDAVCVLLTTAVLVFSLFASLRLEFRLYAIVAALLGMLMYFSVVAPTLRSIVYFVRNKLKFLWKNYNLKKIFRFLCR